MGTGDGKVSSDLLDGCNFKLLMAIGILCNG